MELKTKTLVWIVLLNLIAPAAVRAADEPGTTANTPTTEATRPATRKHHHKHKKTASNSANSHKTGSGSDDSDSHTGADLGNTDARDMSNSLGNNNAGTPNMGSSDHTPGTTGTSGQ